MADVDERLKEGFEVAQCGEQKKLNAAGLVTIDVLLLKKEFDGTTFTGSAGHYLVQMQAN